MKGKGLSLLIGIGKAKPGAEKQESDDEDSGPPDLELEGQAVMKALKAGDAKAFAQALREFIDAHHDSPVPEGDEEDDDEEEDE
jgi:hypothetical protein